MLIREGNVQRCWKKVKIGNVRLSRLGIGECEAGILPKPVLAEERADYV